MKTKLRHFTCRWQAIFICLAGEPTSAKTSSFVNPARPAEGFELNSAGLDRTGSQTCYQHNLHRNEPLGI